MIGVKDEQDVERALDTRVEVELDAALVEEHVQEVRRVRLLGVRVEEPPADVAAERPGADRRRLGDEPDDLLHPVLGVGEILRVGVQRGQPADRGLQDRHRVSVGTEPADDSADALVDVHVGGDPLVPFVELLLRRQLAVVEEVGDLHEARLLGELLDRVPPVAENPDVAVDEGDRAPARRRVHERRVVGHDPEVVLVDLDGPKIRRLDGSVGDR